MRVRKLSSIYVFSYFPFGFEGRIWDLIVSVPDYCLSFYFSHDIVLSDGGKYKPQGLAILSPLDQVRYQVNGFAFVHKVIAIAMGR